MVNFFIGQKVKCIKANYSSSLQLGKIYTISDIFEDGDEYIRVEEINNGNNSFFIWRFARLLPELNNNITILFFHHLMFFLKNDYLNNF